MAAPIVYAEGMKIARVLVGTPLASALVAVALGACVGDDPATVVVAPEESGAAEA